MSTTRTQLLLVGLLLSAIGGVTADATPSVGQPVDIASSAYQYRADRKPDENPPESWIAVMKYAGLPLNKPFDVQAPALKKVLCGLIWEEVRRVRSVALVWNSPTERRPAADDVALTFFDAEVKGTIPTWWNETVLREAGKPEVSADGRTLTFAIPSDTFGFVVSVRGRRDASTCEVPSVRVFTPDRWKRMDLEIEWGFDMSTAALDYSGRIEAYDGVPDDVRPLAGDSRTVVKEKFNWVSASRSNSRRGLRLSLLYQGTSKWRNHWPYNSEAGDVARTIVTVWTTSGNFSFLASDLEAGPILAPEYGFFVRATHLSPGEDAGDRVDAASSITPPGQVDLPPPSFKLKSRSGSAREFVQELAARNLATIRQRTRQHPEQTWEGATSAMFPGKAMPAIPKPEFDPPMKVEVPCEQLTAQWNLGAWHLARHAVKDDTGKLRFNDHPYGILASETYLVLRTLDLLGLHKEASDGLDQWLDLPLQTGRTEKRGHLLAGGGDPDRPAGLFSDGTGCFTNAEGTAGVGGHMDGVHSMGPGAIMRALDEHFLLTGDEAWLAAHAQRIKANVEWILRQRRLTATIIPGGERLWCKGLQPAHQVTPDSGGQLMSFYESEGYYWLAVRQFAEILARTDPAEGARLAAEAESYRRDLRAAMERSIALSPVVLVRDGTYRSVLPFACYVRGLASGPWSWRRPGSGPHVGGLYWDTIQSAESLVDPAEVLRVSDPRVQGALDVLEDRLLLENLKLTERTRGFEPDRDWFAHAGWQYQPGLERHANIHLAGDDAANFLRSWLNQYAVLILPEQGYTFREHTTGGPPDKIFEEAAFLERFRNMLVMEDGASLWLARATPRAWLEQGKTIAVENAPTHFGPVAYEIVSDVNHGQITATVEMPARILPSLVLLRFRHPEAAPLKRVTVNGKPWLDFDEHKEYVKIHGLKGKIVVRAYYR